MEMTLVPGVLIAMPQLVDPNFARTVVLMLHHSEEGAMGLVVNRRTDVTLPDFCEEHDLPHGGASDEDFLHLGGPCELQRGFLLHEAPDRTDQSVLVAPGVYLTTEPEAVRSILDQGRGQVRFLLGYAGWGGEQLEQEISEGAWLTGPVNAERVFGADPEAIWSQTLSDLGVDPARLAVSSSERH